MTQITLNNMGRLKNKSISSSVKAQSVTVANTVYQKNRGLGFFNCDQEFNLKAAATNINGYLSMAVIQKMLNKFLTEANMTKENLAKKLNIAPESVESLLRGDSSHLIPKINYQLCKIFCAEKKFDWSKL